LLKVTVCFKGTNFGSVQLPTSAKLDVVRKRGDVMVETGLVEKEVRTHVTALD
jgi:hypothetical protein